MNRLGSEKMDLKNIRIERIRENHHRQIFRRLVTTLLVNSLEHLPAAARAISDQKKRCADP